MAMEQGLVAGEAICEGLAGGDLRLLDYTRRVRRAPVGRELALDRVLSWLLYDHPLGRRLPGSDGHLSGWGRYLGMVLYDEELLELYAARVAGTLVLAEQRRVLLRVLWRHAARRGAGGRGCCGAGRSEGPALHRAAA